MKKTYQSPLLDVVNACNKDVIMASVYGDDNVGRITGVDWTTGGETV